MLFSTRAILAFLLATTTSVLGTGEGPPVVQGATAPFQITQPATSGTWNLGETVNISWSVPSSIPSDYTAADGYGCNVALFQASDHTTLVVYISQQAVFSAGTFTWTIDGSFSNGSSYSIGVGFISYVVGTADMVIITSPSNSTSLPLSSSSSPSLNATSSTVIPKVTTIVSVATSACTNVTTASTSQTAASSNSTSQQLSSPATSNSQFQAVGGVGGVIGICIGGAFVVGGILAIMFYNSFRERHGHPPGLGSGGGTESRYGGAGSSYGVDHHDMAETKMTSPPTSPGLNPVNLPPLTAITSLGAGSRSTYTPFSKRNPNPHHDNVDLLQVDPFVKPVPAYVLRPDIERGAGDHSRIENEGDDDMKQYNYI